MATSGTTAFTLDLGEIIDEAYEQAGGECETANDVRKARRSLNLLFQEWDTIGIKLWAIEQKTLAVTTSFTSQTLDTDTLDIIDMVCRSNSGETGQLDIPVHRLNVFDWNALANKQITGKPTSFFVDRKAAAPVLYLWPLPSTSYDIVYWRIRRIEDAGISGEVTMDVPERFLPALTAGLAYRLAMKDKLLRPNAKELLTEYDRLMKLAMNSDRDRASIFIAPDMSAYS